MRPLDPKAMSRLLALLALVLVATGVVWAQQATVDSLMEAFDHSDSPGGVVAVVQGGEVTFARAYGMADLTFNVPNTRETLFNIASVSKQFTGIFFAMLAEEGRLSLDDDVRRYAPELPDFGPTVTLRHLLNHTSGYREVYGVLGMQGRSIFGDRLKREDAFDVVRRQPALQFPPGSRRLYNSTAYVILTDVAERIVDQPYPDWMDEHVFGPVGMMNTVIEREAGDVIAGAATSYTTTDRGSYREDFEAYAYYGATDIYTTVDDLARWMRNFRTSELGGPGVMRRMLQRSVSTYGDTLDYTLGLVLDEHLGLERIQHSGSTGGYRSFVAYYPALDAGVVVLANTGAVPVTRVAERTAAVFFANDLPPHAVTPSDVLHGVDVEPGLLDQYAGSYWEPGEGILSLERAGHTLTLTEPADEAGPLVALNDSTFSLFDGVSLRFYPTLGAASLHEIGRGGTRLTRVESARAEPDLSAFAGRYFSPETETFYDVTVEEHALAIVHRRLGTIQLTPLAANVFSGSWPLREIVFERDTTGRVTGFGVTEGRTIGVLFRRLE